MRPNSSVVTQKGRVQSVGFHISGKVKLLVTSQMLCTVAYTHIACLLLVSCLRETFNSHSGNMPGNIGSVRIW